MATVLVALASVAIGGVLFLGPSSDNAERAAFEQELDNAYPTGTASDGRQVDIALTAGVSSLDLLATGPTEVWAYNGSVPGPELRVGLGDTLSIAFRNELPMATTIHWHGVRVPNSMDGVPGVNQPPVEPGDMFLYEFTPPDAGTFWYHSHTSGSEQLERGLYGALIVEDLEPAPYSQDVVWVIDDWLLTAEGEVDPAFNTASDVEHNGRWGDVVTANASTNEVLQARPGERIRLRLINASNGRVYAPRFGGLPAELIAVDGLYARNPQPADGFELAPGNRIDVEIIVPDSPTTVPITDDFTGDEFALGTIVIDGEKVITPEFPTPYNPTVPTWSGAADVSVDHEYRFNIRRGDGTWEWTINDRAYPNASTLDVESGSFTKIGLRNESQLLHPIHVHGLFFKVVSRNGSAADEGYFRDTVLLFPGDEVDIGFVALDEGTWVMHCHIQEHAEAGMMTLLDVQP